MRQLKKSILLVLRGMGMGAADVVPGVSGGTIAFITGIYEELVHSIKSINLNALRLFITGKWGSFWKQVNGTFLLSVFTGIAISVVTFARILKGLLENERSEVLVWAFFFGLILASTYLVSRRVKKWSPGVIVAFINSIALAYYITCITPASTPDAAWFILLSGALASCAMILPGISGSFILLLLGKYEFALHAVSERIPGDLLILGAGALGGLVLFSNFLSWLLRKHHEVTIAVMVGFMIGSLNKVWPWKTTLSEVLVDGRLKPLLQRNRWPSLEDQGDRALTALVFFLLGMSLILTIELILAKNRKLK